MFEGNRELSSGRSPGSKGRTLHHPNNPVLQIFIDGVAMPQNLREVRRVKSD
jgi:hypothetical protein